MKPILKIRKSRSIFRLDPPSCALPQKKVLVPGQKSVLTAIIFYFHHRLQATNFSSAVLSDTTLGLLVSVVENQQIQRLANRKASLVPQVCLQL